MVSIIILICIIVYNIYIRTNINRVNSEHSEKCNCCGFIVEEENIKCPKCNEELKIKCHNCGRTIQNNWRYCPYCDDKRKETKEER